MICCTGISIEGDDDGADDAAAAAFITAMLGTIALGSGVSTDFGTASPGSLSSSICDASAGGTSPSNAGRGDTTRCGPSNACGY